MKDYKTFEELKKELGDKFEKYMYEANIELLEIIKEATECILDFFCTDGYNTVDGKAIADNYLELLKILRRE